MPLTGTITTTESEVDLVVEWRMEKFFSLPETDGEWHWSPDFSFSGERWYLRICPNGSSGSDSSGHVGLELYKYSSGHSIKQTFSLSLKTAKGEKYNEQHFTKNFDYYNYFYIFHQFIPRSELSRRRSDLAPEDVLTVICTMKSSTSAGSETGNDPGHAAVEASTHRVEVSTETVGASTLTMEASTLTMETSTQTVEEKREALASGSFTNPQENKILHDFKVLFLNKEDCDVTIKVKGSEFPAHRVILKARSPVFASTFRHDMKENTTGVLEIQDCDSSIFSDLLCFLYCGDVGIISQENVFGLFTASDKYQVLDLRAKCLEFMKMNITVDTFCETITLALRHSEAELIRLCTEYFKRNVPKIIVTVKWQTFLAENPTEGNELFVKSFVPNSS